MSKWKKATFSLAFIVFAIIISLSWYKQHYSMGITPSFAVTVDNPKHHLLIASQHSDFKNAVLEGVLTQQKNRPINIQVIDVTELLKVKVDDWDAIVILHTWENLKAEANAKLFIEQQANLNKLIVLTTSGDGHLKMKGVDAITSASLLDDVAKHVNKINMRINELLDENTPQALAANPFTCDVPLKKRTRANNYW
jgi:hypothetical protein